MSPDRYQRFEGWVIQHYGIGVRRLFDQRAKEEREKLGHQLSDEEAFTVLGRALNEHNHEALEALLETEKVGFLT